jgi:hypothetical protein
VGYDCVQPGLLSLIRSISKQRGAYCEWLTWYKIDVHPASGRLYSNIFALLRSRVSYTAGIYSGMFEHRCTLWTNDQPVRNNIGRVAEGYHVDCGCLVITDRARHLPTARAKPVSAAKVSYTILNLIVTLTIALYRVYTVPCVGSPSRDEPVWISQESCFTPIIIGTHSPCCSITFQ